MAEFTTTSTWAVAGSVSAGTIDDYVGRYLLERQVEGLSPNSIRLYRFALANFTDFAGERLPIELVDYQLVRSFLFHVYNHGYKPSSLTIFNVAIRIFCKWLHREGLLENDPAAKIAKPKRGKRVPYCLSDEQVVRLLDACAGSWDGRRTRSILLTFLGSGIRVSELAALSMDDINLGAGAMLIKGKGNKERTVPIGGPLAEVIEEWLRIRRKFIRDKQSDAFFVTKIMSGPSAHSVYSLVTRLAVRAKITDVRCSPHTLRHTFATNYMRNGGDVVSLQKIMGHSSINSTLVYVHLALNEVRADFERADPLKKFAEM
ncbi:MAG: tyrosine-type recombinase/integrase [Thermoleophilia bacterium]